MDAVTIVLTGLMVFEGNNVHLVNADMHKKLVQVTQSGGKAQEYVVTKSVAFRNVGTGPVVGATGFQLPKLTTIFQKPGISLKHDLLTEIILPGGTLSPFGSYALCTVKATAESIVFWEGATLAADRKEGATLIIDGEKEIALQPNARIHISNNYTADDGKSHVGMYANALQEGVTLTPYTCNEPYPAISRKGQAGLLRNNPVTCPPTSLQ